MNVGMVFGIIFAIVTMGFVAAFGLPLISDAFCTQEQSQVIKALSDFENDINNFYFLSEGSTKFYEMSLPKNVKICFIDYNDLSENPVGGWTEPNDAVKTLIEGQNYNIWYSSCAGESGKKINYASVADNFCMKGFVRVYLENKGTYVEVSSG
ncbi:MAG: hypothetical protein ABIF08_00510 [Nanoarchaeota archaeon]